MTLTARDYLSAALVAIAAVLIFLIDLLTPLGLAVWLGYVALVLVVAWSGQSYRVYALAAIITVLMALGFFLSPAGIAPWIAGLNRAGGVALAWTAAWLLLQRRRLLVALSSQADTLRQANLLLQDQAEEVEVQAEEIQAQNDELIALAGHLEGRVTERTAELHAANQALQAMTERLLDVQESERRAIARELHDESSQLLTSIKIGLTLLQRAAQTGEPVQVRIEEVKQRTEQLAESLHRLAMNLRPAALDRGGLVPAIEQYVESCSHTYGLQVDLAVDGLGDERLAPEMETALYRVVQEALTNVARHAHATRASVLLSRRAQSVAAIIEDNGAGFDPDKVAQAGRLGLTGMRERAELLHGNLTVEALPGAGTTIFVEIPCPPPALPVDVQAGSEAG